MKLLVAVKRVIDAGARVRLRSDGSGVDAEQLRMSMNPFDEVAVEEAVRWRESGRASEVVAVSVGPAACREVLRTALAMGADRAVLIETDAAPEPPAVAGLLRALCARETPQLVLCGRQASDDGAAQTGPMLAAMLDWPQADCVSRLDFVDGRLVAACEVDDGVENVELTLPAVVSVDLLLNQPRYVSLPQVMQARKKTLDSLSAGTLGVDLRPRLTVLGYDVPPERPGGIRLADADALVTLLKASGVLA